MLELEPVKQLSGKPAILVLGRSDNLCYVALSCCALYCSWSPTVGSNSE